MAEAANLATGSYRTGAVLPVLDSHFDVRDDAGDGTVAPPPIIPAVPNLNPSSSLVVPQSPPVPVSPGIGGAEAATTYFYHSECSVFGRGPCFPHYLPPIGQDLRLTIVSTDVDSPATDAADVRTADDHPRDTIREMFAAFRGCWIPPPKDDARHGMEYTIRFALKIAVPRRTYSSQDTPVATQDIYRDAIDAALKRCMPLRLSVGMAGAIAGRPIAIRGQSGNRPTRESTSIS